MQFWLLFVAIQRICCQTESSFDLTSDSDLLELGSFMVDSTAGGQLFYYEPGKPLQSLDTTVKEVVNGNMDLVRGSFMFLGSKKSTVVAISPLTGSLLYSFGEGDAEPLEPLPDLDDAVFVGKIDYTLNIYDRRTAKLRWKIGYSEMTPGDAQSPRRIDPSRADVLDTSLSYLNAKRLELNDACHPHSNQFPHCLFGTVPSSKVLTLPEPVKVIPAQATYSVQWIGGIGVLGLILGVSLVYLFQFFKTTPIVVEVEHVQEDIPLSIPLPIREIPLSNSLPIKEIPLSIPPIKEIKEDSLLDAQQLSSVTLVRESSDDEIVVEDDEKIVSANLKTLTTSDSILGHGSHGTVVYKGTFEGRPVAVKRLLVDFYNVADHEVKLLQESDDHPNVIRYFCSEKCDGFMYIALELCSASLYDIIERPCTDIHFEFKKQLKKRVILEQITSGLTYLHSLQIVHRDLKPHNILVAPSKHRHRKTILDGVPRVLISDFGLGKKLSDDQSSFHNSTWGGGGAGGTPGWRAPECLLRDAVSGHRPDNLSTSDDSSVPSSHSHSHSAGLVTASGIDKLKQPTSEELQDWFLSHQGTKKALSSFLADFSEPLRVTKAIDIFSLGCLYFYVLTDGGHPFGERFAREVNVLKGNFRLDRLDALKDESHLAKELVKSMIARHAKKRPSSSNLLSHPFFWSNHTRVSFLSDLSDRLEPEVREPPSPLLALLERHANKVFGLDWTRKMDRCLLDDLVSFRKYRGSSFQDLLRAVRNKKHHYQHLSVQAKKILESPDHLASYFATRFPLLLMTAYTLVCHSKELRSDPLFKPYL